MDSFSSVISQMKQTSQLNKDFKVARKDIKVKDNGSLISIGTKDFRMERTGVATLAKTLTIPLSYFSKYPVNGEFSEHANTLLQSKSEEEVLVRSVGDSVRAILPTDYAVYDNLQLFEKLASFGDRLPAYKINILKTTDCFNVFNITYGKALVEKDETYPMVRVSNSEVGLGDFTVEMGLFRLICTNGLVRKDRDYGYLRWSHQLKTAHQLNAFIENALEKGLTRCIDMQNKFEKAREEKITLPFMQIIGSLVSMNTIPVAFASKLIKQSESQPIETKFDLINLITKEAQNEKSWSAQTRYENIASKFLENEIAA